MAYTIDIWHMKVNRKSSGRQVPAGPVMGLAEGETEWRVMVRL